MAKFRLAGRQYAWLEHIRSSNSTPPTACAASWILRAGFAGAVAGSLLGVAEACEGEAVTAAFAYAVAAATI